MLYYKKDSHFEGPEPHIFLRMSDGLENVEVRKAKEAAAKKKEIDEEAKAALGKVEEGHKERVDLAEETLDELADYVPQGPGLIEDVEVKDETPPADESPETDNEPAPTDEEVVAEVISEGESGGPWASLAAAFGSAGEFLGKTSEKFMEFIKNAAKRIGEIFSGKRKFADLFKKDEEEGGELLTEYKERPQTTIEELPVNDSLVFSVPGSRLTSDIQTSREIPSKPGHFRPHKGFDLGVKEGTAIHSPGVGMVDSIGKNRDGDGGYIVNMVYKMPSGPVWVRGMHLQEIPNLKKGQRVEKGDKIGVTGNTGEGSTGPHLHFEIRKGSLHGPPDDPIKYLSEDIQKKALEKRQGKEDGFWDDDHLHEHAVS